MSNAFDLFGLPLKFDIDHDRLESVYLRAQAAVHPDAFVGRSDMEKRLAAAQATTLNEGYSRLKNPLTRAEEFLKAKGVAIPGAQGATVAETSLLEEILEWRDRIQEKDHLSDLHKELIERLENCKKAFDSVAAQDLPSCYLEFIYTYKTLSELETNLET